MAGKLEHDMTDRERRALCNDLAAQGFSIDYLEQRYGITPRVRTGEGTK